MKNRGFTLAELLIVVAIITVLVGVAIPVFVINLEKARLSVDKANIRACYADASYEYISREWDGSEKTFSEGGVECTGTVIDAVVRVSVVSGAKSKTVQGASSVYFEAGSFFVDGVEAEDSSSNSGTNINPGNDDENVDEDNTQSGQGGTNPGHGGTPPGQDKDSSGQGNQKPGKK